MRPVLWLKNCSGAAVGPGAMPNGDNDGGGSDEEWRLVLIEPFGIQDIFQKIIELFYIVLILVCSGSGMFNLNY